MTTEWQVLGQYFFYLETSSPIDSFIIVCTSKIGILSEQVGVPPGVGSV